jgi:hypothetical protein
MNNYKRLAKVKEFNDYLKKGTASHITAVPAYENNRKKVLDNLDAEIVALIAARGHAAVLPIGVMLYVKASTWTGSKKEITGMIITAITINKDSVRCILWGQEKSNYFIESIVEDRVEGKIPLRFTDIKAWKQWEPKDAALSVNFEYLTPAYKRMAFGS